MGKPVRAWPKLRNDGQICIFLHNLSKEPMHVTPRMGVLMIETTDVAIINESGIELKVEKRDMKISSGSKTNNDQGLTIEELHSQSPQW